MKLTEEHKTMIEDCVNRSEKLDDWQLKFIDSIQDAEYLSGRQIVKLEEIWKAVT